MKNPNIPLTASCTAQPSLALHLALGCLALCLQLATAGSIIEITTPPRYSIPETAEHATVTLSRTGDAETEVSVTASTADINTTSGLDYTPVSLVVTFSPGQTRAIVHVPIQNDGLVEKAETFTVSLSSPSPTATLGTQTTLRVIINDNDTGPAFAASTVRTVEDIGTILVVVERGDDGASSSTVEYASRDVTAVAGSDYEAVNGTLLFEPGVTWQNIPVTILNDGVIDPDKSLQLELKNASAGGVGNPSILTLTIQSPTPVILSQPNPASQSLSQGAKLRIAASARGAVMQWQHQPPNGEFTDVPNATNPELVIPYALPSHSGTYRLVASNNSNNSVTSDTATVEVDDRFTRLEMGDIAASWGCAWGDYNGDGYPDLLLAKGTWTSRQACQLYRNNKDRSFTLMEEPEVGEIASRLGNWMNAVWADIDNNGTLDVFVTDNPPNGDSHSVLWLNVDGQRFVEATPFATGDLYGTPVCGDVDRNGQLDLLVANAWIDNGWNLKNALFFNEGNLQFTRLGPDPLTAIRANHQAGALFDMDNDGDLDALFTGNQAFLVENLGNRQFQEISETLPRMLGLSVTPSFADIDNDQRLDAYIAFYNAPGQLLHNKGDGTWTATPLGGFSESSCGMWADYDNDGDLDLFVARGQNNNTTCQLFTNNGEGAFSETSLASLTGELGRIAGCAWADADNNGSQDLFLSTHSGLKDRVFFNNGNQNHWSLIQLVGTASNRSAIGAKIHAKATINGKPTCQTRVVDGGNRYQNDLRAHFGLGDANLIAQLQIEWPSGIVQCLENLPANEIITITETPQIVPLIAGQIDICCWQDQSFDIECSPDLVNWTVIDTITNTTGTLSFQDPEPTDKASCFYRVVAR
ncbi:MAG: hypothetical protein RI897_2943 [Verrucomicrobiota bacterium]|jgi:hypothetical protein